MGIGLRMSTPGLQRDLSRPAMRRRHRASDGGDQGYDPSHDVSS